MDAFRGTFRLLRLNLRLDRMRLLIWLFIIVGIIAITIPELSKAYGSEGQRLAYASATAPSMVTRLLAGAISGPSLGEIVIVETFMIASVGIALMNIFLITKHVRAREESGQAELIGSMRVGRQANLGAALIQTTLYNGIISGLLYLVFLQNDLPAAGSLAYALGIGAVGLVFAGVSAVTSQLFENTRSANGIAGLVFGASFLLRGVGDALGTINSDGVSATTSWVSWLSPLGWVTNMLPFHIERWWVLYLFVVLTTACVSAAFFLLSRRDVGAGIFAEKPGHGDAQPKLLREFGLLWRLNRVAFFAWLSACAVVGATLGGVANEFQSLIAGNEDMQRLLATYGQSTDPADLMFSATFTITGIAIAGYALQLILRMRSEETSGRLELVLAQHFSRLRWFIRWTFFATITSIGILLATGIAAGFVYGIIDGEVIGKTMHMATAILVQAPALLVVAGLGLLSFSALPRYASIVSWCLLGACLLIMQLSALLKLPQWVTNLSPFSHTPAAPAPDISYTALYGLTAVAVTLLVMACVCFQKRDIVSE